MPGLVRKSARDLDRFQNTGVSAQLVLARPAYFSTRHKIGMLKLFQRHRHLRIVQISRVGTPRSQTELLQRESLGQHWPRILQRDIAIRLYGERLVELWRKREAQCHHIAVV